MPIYVKNKIDWKLVDNIQDIKPTDIIPLRNIIVEAKQNFEYKNIINFTDSVILCTNYNTNMAKYNIAGTGIDEPTYIKLLESLINKCNDLLIEKNKTRYKKYKYDIMGNWTKGQIVLMIQK